MDHIKDTIDRHPPWVLLDEQVVVFERIRTIVRSGLRKGTKHVVLIRGGPGTGKSVLAIKLMSALLGDGHNTHYATGSRAFTETLRSIVGKRAEVPFRYFNSYGGASPDEVDVLICDEAHRIRETSNGRFTRKGMRSNRRQLEELVDASKVSVFFIDDQQGVRPNEIGSSDNIRAYATERGANLSEYELDIQFRCAGSDGFVNWIDNTLGLRHTANALWDGSEGFDFRIVRSPEDLEAAIRQKNAAGDVARLAAGFCWPWSSPKRDGTLVDDVVIGPFERPWNAKPGDWKLAPGIPSASLWARDPGGIDQIGCVYTAQGFDLDYVGVIWGPDLRYDLDQQRWIGDKTRSADHVVNRSGDQFADLVKRTYRVLLSRGIKGCFVHFVDRDTERFVRTRVRAGREPMDYLKAAEPDSSY
jgi:hypothetical protein